MNKFLVSACFIIPALFVKAQNGLENIVVEKYYISDANDTSANPDGGTLPVGSVTYRIYADLNQGYNFQAAFGVPGHELRLETTTFFFNNIDRGAPYPTYTKTQARGNTVMLDSWLSVGAACVGNYGILKSVDDGVSNVVNNYVPQVLQNNDPGAGIPLTVQDGLIAGTPEAVTPVGLTANEIALFDATNYGNLLSTWNASWASLNHSKGPDTVDNKVLIAQITTDGIFSFKLNIQIGTPVGGNTESYVADSAVGNEIVLPSLIQSFLPPSVKVPVVTAPPPFWMEIYPNPVSDLLRLNITAAKPCKTNRLAVYDTRGQEVFLKYLGAMNGVSQETIDVSRLAKGQYIVELSMDGFVSTKQMIKN